MTPAEAIAHSTIETDELRLRQVRLLSRFTPINVLTALAAAWLVAAVSWPFVPSTLLGGWLAVQTVLSVGAIYRWWRLWQRRRSGDRPIRSRTYGRAVVWAAFGGVVWGAVVLFMPYLPPAACVTVSMVLVSLAVGASITYAPVAPAAGAFVVTALAPSAVYALFEGNSEQIWVGLVGLLGIVVFTSIAKVVQRGFQEEIRARIAVRTSEQALERERSEWLDATNISAAIALFDEADRLLRWNQPYETLLGPGPWLERGARRSEMFLHWSNGNRSAVEQALFPDSSRPAGDGPFVEHQLASGRWIRSSARILPNGRLVEVHQDVTAERSLGELLNASAEWGRLLVRIALAANEAGARASDILGPVCRLTGWKAALAWQRRPAGSGYTLAGRWPDERGADDGQADPSLRLGLDDRASRRLLSDGVQVFSHVASAAEMGGPQPAAGVRSGVLVAVPIGDQLAGLLEFLDAGNVSLTGNMSSVLSQIGVQVGRLWERERASAALRASEARFRAYAEASADWFWETDVDGRLTQLSSSDGERTRSSQHALGRPLLDLVVRPFEPGALGVVETAIRGRRAFRNFIYETVSRAGDRQWFAISGIPIIEAECTFVGYRGAATDITERISRNAQAQQSQKMEAVGRLTGGVAHDFNNLLTVIIGNLELLAGRPLDDRARNLVRSALRAAERGAGLTGRLLSFARRQSQHSEVIDVGALIFELVDFLGQALSGSHEISMKKPDGALWASVDRSQLENAITNLVFNARDAMPRGGRLSISVTEAADPRFGEGRVVAITVTDTGVGIPPENRDRVFEPFFTTKSEGAGSGLGLSIVYGFVQRSGGQIDIDSEVGRGTTVRLMLPIVKAPASVEPTEVASPEAIRPARILVVEDNDDVRFIAVAALRAQGHDVVEAADGPAAIRRLAELTDLDLLLSDVVLPGGIFGPDIAQRVRERFPGAATLFVSGYAGTAAFGDLELGAGADLLMKPYTAAALGNRVRKALKRRE